MIFPKIYQEKCLYDNCLLTWLDVPMAAVFIKGVSLKFSVFQNLNQCLREIVDFIKPKSLSYFISFGAALFKIFNCMMARRSKMAAKVFKYGVISFLLSSPAKIYNLLDVNSYDVIDRFSSLLLDIKIPKTSYPNARRFFLPKESIVLSELFRVLLEQEFRD